MHIMVNKARKGQHREYMARKQLEANGWLIVFKSIRNRFGCIDFAGLFDIVAYKHGIRKYISCKHFGQGNYHQEHQKEIKEFKKKYQLPCEEYELWLWAERKPGRKAQWIKVII